MSNQTPRRQPRIRPEEMRLVFLLAALLFVNSLARELSNVVSVSGFITNTENNYILIVWAVDMLLIAGLATVQSLIVDRFDRIQLVRSMVFGLALVYLVLRLLFTLGAPGWLNYSILFLVAEQQWLFFPLVFWIMANDIMEMNQAKRLFPIIATGGILGEIAGFGLGALAPSLLARLGVADYELLSFNVLIYMLVFIAAGLGFQGVKVRQVTQVKKETVKDTLSEGWGFVREVPSFRFLMLSIIAISVVVTVLDFHFLSVISIAYPEQGSFQTFYSLYSLGVALPSILMQAFLTGQLLEQLELKNVFIIMPVVAIIGAAIALVGLGLISAAASLLITSTVAIGLVRFTKETIDQSANKAFQALVPEERRGRVSLFMDSYMFAFGTLIGCLITGLIVVGGLVADLPNPAIALFYLAVGLIAAGLAGWSIFVMRSHYDASLLNWRLKRRQRRADILDKLQF